MQGGAGVHAAVPPGLPHLPPPLPLAAARRWFSACSCSKLTLVQPASAPPDVDIWALTVRCALSTTQLTKPNPYIWGRAGEGRAGEGKRGNWFV